jgi:hypothetical protein
MSLAKTRLLFAPALVLLTASAVARAEDPTTADCLTANVARAKLQNEHRLREAREQLLLCAAQACPKEVREECDRVMVEVNAAIPTIVFEVRDASGSDLTNVRVSMDGKLLVERLDGAAISIDPGEHVFVFEAPGAARVEKRFVIRESEKARRERVSIGESTAPAAGATPASPPADKPDARAPAPMAADGERTSAAPEDGGKGALGTIGLVAAGAGVLGLGLGAVFGLQASSKQSQANCPDNVCTSESSLSTLHDAKSAGNLSTAFFVTGGVLLAGGVTLWALAPRTQVTGQVTGESAGLGLEGVW